MSEKNLHSSRSVPQVRVITRCFAKALDLCACLFVGVILPYPLGVLCGLAYTLLHDALPGGQSIGKRVFHLRVVRATSGAVCDYRTSAVRNSPLGVAMFFAIIPFWGWIILILLGLPLMLLEVYLMLRLKDSGRLGDVMADTEVVEAPRRRG